MILAGEAAARFGTTRGIPAAVRHAGAARYADSMKGRAEPIGHVRAAAHLQAQPVSQRAAPHSGLGLSAYAQATSPMRRYLDLVVHQQLRAYLADAPLLTAEQILERIGEVEAILPSTRQAEQLSKRHWMLVYLLRHPDWRGRGVLVDKRRTTAWSSSRSSAWSRRSACPPTCRWTAK